MSKSISVAIKRQTDLSEFEHIGLGAFASVYKVKQLVGDESRKQVVRLISDIRDSNSIKREKDLLNYFNQFPEFINFNEIRKVGYNYLQFFDFVGKDNLKQHIQKKGLLTEQKAKQLLENMIAILERVHGVGFVHGDIKPTNIICGKKKYFLIDWTSSIPSLSSFSTETLVGDKKYCPPERLNGLLDGAGDVYSLGCALYFSLTGKHIFGLEKVEDMNSQLWSQVHQSAVFNIDTLSVFWQNLISWMTQKDPKKRPSLVDLKTLLSNYTIPDRVILVVLPYKKIPSNNLINSLISEGYIYPTFKRAIKLEKQGDLEQAFKLYEICAFKGYSRAENNLGLMYQKGKFVCQSYPKAVNLFYQSFKKGNSYAAYNLARLFEKGLGIEANLMQSYKMYKFAALRGNLSAQNKLGEAYLAGKGMKKNIVQARFWFGLASCYGNVSAKSNLLTQFINK